MDSKQSSRAQMYRQIGPYLGIGIEFVVAILLCLFLGQWLDGKWGTGPVLMLVGAFVGAAVGFYSLIRTVLKLQDGEKQAGGSEAERSEDAE